MPEQFQLNLSQQAAVTHLSGPILVVAGAGTGKTRVITERIKHLVTHRGIHYQDILALTFTEKASREMQDRLYEVMPYGYLEPWVYTFHTFCERILSREGLELGLDTAFDILDYPKQWALLRNHIFDLELEYFRPLGNPARFISEILKFISRLQDENISPQEFLTYVQRERPNFTAEDYLRYTELSTLYASYQTYKLEKSKLDFGDLITWTLKLFKDRPNILKKYQIQFKHVLVDEFQDTNLAQYELIKLLCPVTNLKDRSLVVVGDDSQSIYKFRGAAVSNILGFMQDYKAAKMITLLTNYRSTQPILDAAYKVIQNNNPDTLESKLGISKELVSQVAASTPVLVPKLVEVQTGDDEVLYVIKKLIELLATEPTYTYRDVAILARANNHLDPFVLALKQLGLPYQLVGNRGLYDQEEIRDILALVRVLVLPDDSVSFYRLLNVSVFNISSDTIVNLLTTSRAQQSSLWESAKLSQDDNVQNLLKKLQSYQGRLTELSPAQLLTTMLTDINYLAKFLQTDTIEAQLAISNINIFLTKVRDFEVQYRKDVKELPTILNYLDHLELMLEAGENPAQAEIEDIDTINLMTVHASKGLEFGLVFVVNLVSDRFPTRDRKDKIELPDALVKELLPEGDEHIQEERRLFYVAMTRAKKHLHLTYALTYGGKREKHASGFLTETGLAVEKLETTGLGEQLWLPKPPDQMGPKPLKADAKLTTLSYSKLSDYETCPLRYKYAHILALPTPPTAALSFGSTIHSVLKDLHARLLSGFAVTLADTLTLFETYFQPTAYSSRDERAIYQKKGQAWLTTYYQTAVTQPSKTLYLEKDFTLKIGDVRFTGRIDRIDQSAEGEIEIIDYKTGDEKSQKLVDKDEQLAIYAFACQETLKLLPTKLSLYYLKTNQKLSTTPDQELMAKMKTKIEQTVDAIKESKFEATPSEHACKMCPYRKICPSVWKG